MDGGNDMINIKIPENIGDSRLFSVKDLLKLCEDQNNLLKEEDKQIGRFIAQLSEYEQELYEKDSYIEKLEDVLQNLKTSHSGEEVI